MTKIREVTVKKERVVRTYAELWHTSYCLFKKGEENPEGSFHQFMASLVFTAFTLEAYLNHLGARVHTCWNGLERLAPIAKLNLLAEKIGVDIDYGRRPWQVMKDLFGFRNDIAHGKSVEIEDTEVLKLASDYENTIHERIQTPWEKYCTRTNAERARQDVGVIIVTLHEAAGLKDEYPFISGMQFATASLLDE